MEGRKFQKVYFWDFVLMYSGNVSKKFVNLLLKFKLKYSIALVTLSWLSTFCFIFPLDAEGFPAPCVAHALFVSC